MAEQKPREIALKLLEKREESGAFIEQALDRALEKSALKPEDRRLAQELVYGVCRWQLTLDSLIARKSGGNPQKSVVQNVLRMGLYQMFWLERVPGYAAVNESVELCKRHGFIPQARFVNAVLRAYGRESGETKSLLEKLKETDPAIGYSHPGWLVRRWEERWGKRKTVSLMEWNNIPPVVFARVNTLKTDPASLIRQWEQEKVEFHELAVPWAPAQTVFQLGKHAGLFQLPSFKDGLFYLQDPSTLLAVNMLEPQPGEAILDLCAAPGGKTTYIAQSIRNEGRIMAEDVDPDRLELVRANCQRLGVTSVTTDPSSFPADCTFDRVLLDAPCSNTGVMRRRVELRWGLTPEEIARLATQQRQLLKQAARRTRIGGTLVYSTCSLEREENDAVVREFIAGNSRFELEEERAITPWENKLDGAYVAKLRRKG